ncbi:hypothetical protein LIER_27861 [Lithospermum erythrorhizon]|uniref:Uncharacterized protein n=1 Tax=Lithospermum erythrorhizon TaxID=34254 RepID=A0AAV3RFK8_LITER
MPPHFYTDRRVLKVAGFFPIADADLGALEALKVSYNVPDHVPPSPSTSLGASTNQSILRAVMVGSFREEDEALSPLSRRYLPFFRLTYFVETLVTSILTWAARYRPHPSASEIYVPNCQFVTLGSSGRETSTPPSPEDHFSFSPPLLVQSRNPPPSAPQAPGDALVDVGEQYSNIVILESEDQGGVSLAVPKNPSSVPLSTPEPQVMKQAMSPTGGSIPPRKRMRSPPASPRASHSLRRSDRTHPSPSSAAHNHAELISSLSA